MTSNNLIYNILIATSVTTAMSCAYATDPTSTEEFSCIVPTSLSKSGMPLFPGSEQRVLVRNLESPREACTAAVAQKRELKNARAILQRDDEAALEVIRLKNEEIEALNQAQLRMRFEFELQIQELNQAVARLAARALEVEASRAIEVQARQLAEAKLLQVQQERDEA